MNERPAGRTPGRPAGWDQRKLVLFAQQFNCMIFVNELELRYVGRTRPCGVNDIFSVRFRFVYENEKKNARRNFPPTTRGLNQFQKISLDHLHSGARVSRIANPNDADIKL